MAEMAVQGLLEFLPCKSVNNLNFGLPNYEDFCLEANMVSDEFSKTPN